MFSLLLSDADVSYGDDRNNGLRWTPLAYACQNCHGKLVELLLLFGAYANGVYNPDHHDYDHIDNVDGTNNDTNSMVYLQGPFREAPLSCTIVDGHIDIVTVLLHHNDDINILNSTHETPLMLACISEHINIM